MQLVRIHLTRSSEESENRAGIVSAGARNSLSHSCVFSRAVYEWGRGGEARGWLGFSLDYEVQAEMVSPFVEVCFQVVLDEIRNAAPDQCPEHSCCGTEPENRAVQTQLRGCAPNSSVPCVQD